MSEKRITLKEYKNHLTFTEIFLFQINNGSPDEYFQVVRHGQSTLFENSTKLYDAIQTFNSLVALDIEVDKL